MITRNAVLRGRRLRPGQLTVPKVPQPWDVGRLRGWKSGLFKMTAPFFFALQARLDLCLHPCCNTAPLPLVKFSAHHIWCWSINAPQHVR